MCVPLVSLSSPRLLRADPSTSPRTDRKLFVDRLYKPLLRVILPTLNTAARTGLTVETGQTVDEASKSKAVPRWAKYAAFAILAASMSKNKYAKSALRELLPPCVPFSLVLLDPTSLSLNSRSDPLAVTTSPPSSSRAPTRTCRITRSRSPTASRRRRPSPSRAARRRRRRPTRPRPPSAKRGSAPSSRRCASGTAATSCRSGSTSSRSPTGSSRWSASSRTSPRATSSGASSLVLSCSLLTSSS